MRAERALVLAGGGVAGIAWETGVLCGICDILPDAGRALLDSDVLLGTSAGAAVAAQIGSALPIEELYERQVSSDSPEIAPGVEVDTIAELFLTAMLTLDITKEQKLVRIGAVAAATDTVAEPVRRTVIEHRLPCHDWPQRELRITAIPIDTGELVVFDKHSGVELVDAVAASCAVPGVWPPVSIGGRRYMDGGVGSTVNMAAVADCASAVVLVPSAADAPSPWGQSAVAEIAGWPGRTHAVFADEQSRAGFGANPLDPRCRIPSAVAGRAQGRREAERVAEALDL